MFLPPADEVEREDNEREDEQIQEKEEPPHRTPEMINQVLTYLSGLSNLGHPSKHFCAPVTQVLGVQYTTIVSPNKDASLETSMFPRFTTEPI